MATRKRWSRTVGTRRGNRIRIYQRAASGNLQMAVWDPEKKQYRADQLGHTDRERATREAAEMVRLRDAGEWIDSRSLTLGILVARWLAENTHARDGSLKTEHYRRGCERYAKYMIDWFAPTRRWSSSRLSGWPVTRRLGATARSMAVRSVQRRPSGHQAPQVHDEVGDGSVQQRPAPARSQSVDRFRGPEDAQPDSAMIDDETVEKLMAVADRVNSGDAVADHLEWTRLDDG